MWLQNKRDALLERSRPPSMRRDEQHEFRIGRLKHERVRVPRGNAVRFQLFESGFIWSWNFCSQLAK